MTQMMLLHVLKGMNNHFLLLLHSGLKLVLALVFVWKISINMLLPMKLIMKSIMELLTSCFLFARKRLILAGME